MDRNRLGREAEEVAVRYLESQGWTIMGRNVRAGRREVDIIATRGGVLAFVEVKCRTGTEFGHPLEAITAAKREEIARVARAWLQGRRLPPGTTVRFDAVSVIWPVGRLPQVCHLPDAWRMG
jgi:putative endonuclease